MKRKLMSLSLAFCMLATSVGSVTTFADEAATEAQTAGAAAETTEAATETVTETTEVTTQMVSEQTTEAAYVKSIDIAYAPLKNSYALNETFRTEGIEVLAIMSDGSSSTLKDSEYSYYLDGKKIEEGYVFKGSGSKNIIVKLNSNTSIMDSFRVDVSTSAVSGLEVTPPAKTAYYIGDELDTTGLEVMASFADRSGKQVKELLKADEYKVEGFDSSTAGEKNVVVKAKSSSAAATFTVVVKQKQSKGITLAKYPRTTYIIGEEFDATDMKVGIGYDNGDIDDIEYTVDTSAFDTSKVGTTSVTIKASGYDDLVLPITVIENNDNKWRTSIFGQTSNGDDPSKASVTAEQYGTVNGKINVKSWEGSGKITNDHDGMSYYYTSIDSGTNFKLSADITVNKYLEHDNDDTKRNGQEAFGIMARDAVPFKDSQGNIIINEADAVKDSEGVAESVIDGRLFASNMCLLGGYSGRGWPDKSRANYEKETKLNRINLLVREGVTEIDGGGTRVGPYAVSSDFPKEGNKYRLTLERFNGGLYAKCYNYQTDETMEQYYYDESFLTTQNEDNYYVGFFAARWADIDVTNVDFHEIARATDQVIVSDESGASVTPKISWRDKTVSTTTDYNFNVNVGATNGRITIKLNDTVVVQDEAIKGTDPFSCKLVPNSINKLYIYYTPSDALKLSSYKPIIVKKDIIARDAIQNTTFYASPDGTLKGSGSYDSPLDIDTAMGILQPGQTLVLKEGTYVRETPIEIQMGDDGRAGAYKTVKAEDGKKVVIDGGKTSAIVSHTGNYWRYEGIEFANSGDNLKAFHLGGSNNIIDKCVFRDNGDLGLQISRVSGAQTPDLYPANNLISNCEAYNNCDPSMINADGFGCKLTVGEGNKFVNCKSHHNLDDGWDLYTKLNSGAIGTVVLENCEAYKNGYRLNEDGTETPYGAGGNNGFKMGGENVFVQHTLINCKAYDNAANGITTNSNPAIKLRNVKVYNNGAANVNLYSDKPEEFNYDVENLISVNGGAADILGSVNFAAEYNNKSMTPLLSPSNYWVQDDGTSINSKGEKADISMVNK